MNTPSKSSKKSLAGAYPRQFEVPGLLMAATAMLVCGLALPTIVMQQLVFWRDTFSIVTGIQSLCEEQFYALAGIVFVFSIIFPITKLIAIAVLWFGPLSEQGRGRLIICLGVLGKWSMLDVFIVAVTVVVTKASGLVKAKPLLGIYFFALAVILSILLSWRIETLNRRLSQNTSA